MTFWRSLLAFTAASVSVAGGARAAPPEAQSSSATDSTAASAPYSEPAPAPGDPPQRWYGGETLIVDGLSIGVLVAAASARAPELAWVGAAGYVFGGPIVHWGRNHVGTGFGSLGLRVGLPVGGALVGLAVADCRHGRELCGLGEAAVGFGLGALSAIVIDSAVLAWEDASDPRQRAVTSFRAAPMILRDGAGVTLGGAY